MKEENVLRAIIVVRGLDLNIHVEYHQVIDISCIISLATPLTFANFVIHQNPMGMILSQLQIYHFVSYLGNLTPFAKQAVKEMAIHGYRMEYFRDAELLIDITEHK
jgi:hypothetical protein